MTFARKLFDAQLSALHYETELTEHIFRILSVKASDDVWPFEDHHDDHYDSSLELDGCQNDFRLTPEQRVAFWELGFVRIWLNHIDGMETFYAKTFEGESRKKSVLHPPRTDVPRES